MFSKELINKFPTPVKFFTNAILKNKLANSYIFITKNPDDSFLFAIELAKTLNCTKKATLEDMPCSTCLNCQWISEKKHPTALLYITPDVESKKGQVKIDLIRELLSTLQISSDSHRIVFFPASDINSLPQDSANLLLKTIEEAPPKTVFIFSNKSKENIIPTITSRCQIIYLTTSTELMLEKDFSTYSFQTLISNSPLTALDKSKELLDYIDKNDLDLKKTLQDILMQHYKNNDNFLLVSNSIMKAQNKLNAFMQPRHVIEDLFLELTI